MKPLIRHHQNLLQMTNRRDCRKSIESSPGTTFPPYHNFYSIGGYFSEDMICTYIVSYKLTKIRLSATGNWISLFSIGTSIFSAIWRPVIFGTSGLGVLVELAKIECEFAMKVDEFEDSFCRGFSKQEPLLKLNAQYVYYLYYSRLNWPAQQLNLTVKISSVHFHGSQPIALVLVALCRRVFLQVYFPYTKQTWKQISLRKRQP